eukprot:12462532-Heterocapsa_arctica.AAC.1
MGRGVCHRAQAHSAELQGRGHSGPSRIALQRARNGCAQLTLRQVLPARARRTWPTRFALRHHQPA